MVNLKQVIIAVIIVFSILIIGTTGYVIIEKASIIDSLYMTIITISTVGFGEIFELSSLGRIFTSILILGGLATIAYAASTIAAYLLEKVMSSFSEKKKMLKKIAKLKNHYIICGYGRVGSAAIEIFKKAKVEFVIIESDDKAYANIIDAGLLGFQGNCTNEDVLLQANIKKARGLLALLNSDPDNLFLVLTARELNPTLYITARSSDVSSEKKILRAGSNKVFSPLATAGGQMANNILEATGQLKHLDFDPNLETTTLQWIDIKIGSSMVGETISDISDEMQLSVIGIRQGKKDIIYPDKKTKLNVNDSILIIKLKETVDEDKEENVSKQILIVDDNPVILHLYSRLIAKKGYIPSTAKDGNEALKKIIEIKPDAAVLDFMLPVISGIEVCKKIKQEHKDIKTKIILFTGDENPKTRIKAMEAGADDFILKTSETSDLINSILKILQKNI